MASLELYPFQHDGSAWMANTARCILADEMGLGKTIQAIEAMKLTGASRILVICRNRLKHNWAREIRRWYPIAPVHIVSGTTEDKADIINDFDVGVAITNYESIRPTIVRNREQVDNPVYLALKSKRWEVVIADEAHWLANRKSGQREGAKQLTARVPYLWLLSGTYIRNKIGDLWSLLNLVDRKKWSSYWRFMEIHAAATPGKYGWVYASKATDPEALALEILGVVLQRDRRMVGMQMPITLPVKRTWLSLEDAPAQQARIYQEIEQHMLSEIGPGVHLSTPSVLSQIGRLKQICVSPQLVGAAGEAVGVKLDGAMESIFNLVSVEGRKVVVFSQYVEALELMRQRLVKNKYGVVEISGRKTERQQQAAEESFQNDPAVTVMLASMAAAGEGLNLTAGSANLFLDRDWNPNVHLQCRYRTDRHGQKREVYTEELSIADTIEDWIENQFDDKEVMMSEVISLIKGRYNANR